MMPLPAFPTIRFADVDNADLSALATWLRDSTAAVEAEQARRTAVRVQVARAAAYRIATEGHDDPRWTPLPWDGARIAAGPHSGRTGFIVDRCGDGCEQVDGQPRWQLYIAGGGPVVTCIPREHLRPVATVRRDTDPPNQRRRCDYKCLCCKSAPRAQLAITGTPANH
ncbi:hypothetical protein [Verrucosispora sp. WMMC514]|uniref:hypothetical protein n=1 Tax=Verrucosispora sp. WMMC514 TaxID=3015156 RepID=UPI00248ABBD9|nr:hypothetical protein [Verrucosispora sp. WMMC514]WBB94100.1 hypothetical protein O7597_14560 [Verrucosispora sp. WMMC514]